MKNKILIITILTMLFLPVNVQAEEDIASVPTEPENIQEEVLETPSFTYKQPVSRRKIAKKFLLAMGGVGISSLLIFLVLSMYNRIREDISRNPDFSIYESSLHTPDDLQSAVKSFLSKTNWKG